MSFRVLATAYACEPGVGSEGGIGWSWAREIALRNELVLVTRANNVESIRAAAEEEGLPLEVVGFDLRRRIRMWKRGSRGALTYFALWQKGLARIAQELHSDRSFDVTHHLTFASSWIGSGLAKVDAPFVWGPVGHHDPIPGRFQRPWNLVGRAAERAKAAARSCLPTLDPLARTTRERADVILSLGGELPGHLSPDAASRVWPMLACGIDADTANAIPNGRDGEALRVLFAGRLVDLKGPDLAIEAFARLYRQHPNAQLDLVGEGPRRAALESLARSLGVEDAVTFRGRLSHVDTLDSMSRSHLFLFPSFEGAGMVVVEAMARACPVVCLDLGGPGRMVTAQTGRKAKSLTTRADAIDGLTEALCTLSSDEPLRLELAENARDWALSEASWSAKGDRLESIYSTAIDQFEARRAAFRGAA